MSRIYFHSRDDGDIEISGRERAFLANALNRFAFGCIGDGMLTSFQGSSPTILKIVEDDCYLHNYAKDRYFNNMFETWLSVGTEDFIHPFNRNKKIEHFSVVLNTALEAGNDVVKLMARIHGQCEIHCFVRKENIEWFADLLQKGYNMKKD